MLKISTIKALVVPDDSSRVKITRLSINSAQSDFSPFLVKDQLYFVSSRPSQIGIVYADEANNSEMSDIYYVRKKDSISFNEPLSLPVLNTKYNEGPIAINKQGDMIYFSGNEIKKGKNGISKLLKIYSSKKVNNKWTKPELLSFCKDSFSYCHPALSNDGKTLVFCSDKPGGYGGMDIYIINSIDGHWSAPVNAGNKINSINNEVFPFLSSANILLFSSNRADGFGGLDIYSFDLNDPIDNDLKKLPVPINSPADDFGICTDSTNEAGYFSTNRISKYKDDIYYFAIVVPDFSDATVPTIKNKFCYTFFEETTLEDKDTVNLTYEWDFGNGKKVREKKVRYCFDKPGDYPIQLNIVEKNSDEVFQSEASYVLNIERPEQLYITCCDTIGIGKELKVCCEGSAIKGYNIEKIYWNFGDGKYNYGTTVNHNFKTKGVYTIELGIVARKNESNQIGKFKITKKIIVTESI